MYNTISNVYSTTKILNFCMYQYLLYNLGFQDITTTVTKTIAYATQYNILIIKVIQSMAGTDKVSKQVSDIFTQNTTNVYCNENELNPELLDKIIKKYNIQLIQPQPVNAGMIAFVYIGKIGDQKVVIKIKRKNIEQRIQDGCDNLNFIFDVLHKILPNNSRIKKILTSIDSVTKTSQHLLSQCNFDTEIKATITTKSELENYPLCNNIIIPTIYNSADEQIKSDFIVQEFLEGIPKNSFLGSDTICKNYIKTIMMFTQISVLFLKYYHTDLHIGNIIFMENNKLGIIDFGMCLQMSKEMKQMMFEINQFTYLNGCKEYNFCKHLNCLILNKNNIVDTINEHDKEIINKLLSGFTVQMRNGTLTEEYVNTEYEKARMLMNKSFEVHPHLFLIMISNTMMNSTYDILLKHHKSIENKVLLEEVYTEMIES